LGETPWESRATAFEPDAAYVTQDAGKVNQRVRAGGMMPRACRPSLVEASDRRKQAHARRGTPAREKTKMRVLMKVQMPVESGNEAIRNGKLPQIIAQTLETVKAEAAYFTTMDGKRPMLVVFDLKAVATCCASPSRCSWASMHRWTSCPV
jgi:hypothetical protein